MRVVAVHVAATRVCITVYRARYTYIYRGEGSLQAQFSSPAIRLAQPAVCSDFVRVKTTPTTRSTGATLAASACTRGACKLACLEKARRTKALSLSLELTRRYTARLRGNNSSRNTILTSRARARTASLSLSLALAFSLSLLARVYGGIVKEPTMCAELLVGRQHVVCRGREREKLWEAGAKRE